MKAVAPIGIGRRGDRSVPAGVAGALLACHERIRRFSALALDLIVAPDVPSAERAEAAAAVHRYFTIALPLHARDEDDSLAPRLLSAIVDGSVADAVQRMSAEHVPIEALIAELAPDWTALAAEPESLPERGARLTAGARRLAELFGPHLAAEEAIIFPALTRLPASVEEAMLVEMRARRQTDTADPSP